MFLPWLDISCGFGRGTRQRWSASLITSCHITSHRWFSSPQDSLQGCSPCSPGWNSVWQVSLLWSLTTTHFISSSLEESHYAQHTLKYWRFMLFFSNSKSLPKFSTPLRVIVCWQFTPGAEPSAHAPSPWNPIIYIKCTESCTGGLPVYPIYLFYAVIYISMDSMFILYFGFNPTFILLLKLF